MKRKKLTKYDNGGINDQWQTMFALMPQLRDQYQSMAAQSLPIIQDNLGMEAPMDNNIQDQSFADPANPVNNVKGSTNTSAKPKKKMNANIGMGININTLPLLQGADALITNFIYNPMMKREQMKALRNQLAPVQAATNFNGTDMPIYRKGGKVGAMNCADGGTITTRQGKKKNIVVTEDLNMYAPEPATLPQYSMMDLPLYGSNSMTFNPQQVSTPSFTPSIPREISYEKLYGKDNSVIGYSPIFQGDWSQNQIRNIWGDIPASLHGLPVSRGDSWKELWSYAQGGQVSNQFNVDPMMANALVEGGEMMQLPNGDTVPITGDKHSDPSGGEYMNLPNGTRIFSDKLKADKEFASDILGKKSGKMTFSKLAKKFDTSKEDAILNSAASDKIALQTAELMKSQKEMKLDMIFNNQESKKNPSATRQFAKGGKVGERLLNGISNVANNILDFAPEFTAAIQNMTDFPIYMGKYQPSYISNPQQLNVNDSLNRNMSSVQPLLESNSGNASIDSARALQALANLHDADNQVLAQKFNYDAQQRQRTSEYNNQLANQANMINMQQMDRFWDKVTQRQASKEMTTRAIADSAYQKSKAKQFENRQLEALNTMFPHVAYDPVTGYQNIANQGDIWRVSQLYNQLMGGLNNPADGVNATYTEVTDSKGNVKRIKRLKES